MRPDAELARFGCVAGGVADHLHGHHGFLGECFQHGWGVAEAFEEDLPDRGAEAFGFFVVGPDWGSEVGFWEIGPYIWAVEAGGLDDWVFVADKVGLCSIAFSYVVRAFPSDFRYLPLLNQARHLQPGACRRTLRNLCDTHCSGMITSFFLPWAC